MNRSYARDGQYLEATVSYTADDIAFAAGFFEGEGYCGVIRKGSKSCTIHVGQKDPEMLFKLRNWFGGSIRYQSHTGANGIRLAVWLLNGDRARKFLRLIYPYLSLRRKAQVEQCPGVISDPVTTTRRAPAMGDDIVWPRRERRESAGTETSTPERNSVQ